MAFPLQEQYVNLLTDFGFKRVFGSEPHKGLLIDFLNTLLPAHHQIKTLSYKSSENLGNTPIDRKAVFDIYCEGENGDRFIVEIQKAKQNFFKDRSVFYASFPIQEQAQKGQWDFKLAPVYSIGVLDFVFDDHRDEETLLHLVELKDQRCEVFYDKLKFIYIELPKFQKTLKELDSHQDKWFYLLRHLPELEGQPKPFQDSVFLELFEVAEIANFSPNEQDAYQSSLKYYRDLNNVIDTSWQDGLEQGLERGLEQGLERGLEQGLEKGRAEGLEQGQRALILRQLGRRLGPLPESLRREIGGLSLERLERLGDALFEFSGVDDVERWLGMRDGEAGEL